MARRRTHRVNLPSQARVALYWAPAADDPLAVAGNAWLGRDPATGAALAQPALPDIAAITADARGYGFHATLKPPMRLREGRTFDALLRAVAGVADRFSAFTLPSLAVADLDGFLALCLAAPCPAMQALCDACVAETDDFRAPPGASELARRQRMGLSPHRAAMLHRWGYPDVFDTWVFHMTLTRRLMESETAVYRPAAVAHFAPALALACKVRDVSVFVQPAPGAPFVITERLPLRASAPA